MNIRPLSLRHAALALALALAMTLAPHRMWAATAEDFGYGNLKLSGQLLPNHIPLLVILYQFPTNGSNIVALAHDTNYYNQLIFNLASFPSLNGYFLENSYGSFFWQNAGAIGPVSLNASEVAALNAQHSTDFETNEYYGIESAAGNAYLLGLLAAKSGYNFAQWDANGDGFVDQRELSILAIGNISDIYGRNRGIGADGAGAPIAGQNVTVRGRLATIEHRASLMTLCHELSHSLRTVDLYGGAGGMNLGLTLMDATLFGTSTNFPADSRAYDDGRTYHLDPWHKMRLGWLRPRIFDLTKGGITTVGVSQYQSPNTPVILYDPPHGSNEFFMIEFRNNRPTGGAGYDLNLTDSANTLPFTGSASGMVVWHIFKNASNKANDIQAYAEGAPNFTKGGNTLWNQTTPPLQWYDGSTTATTLNVVGVQGDGKAMVFEWLASGDTWVDFNANASTPDGSFALPYKTVSDGLAHVSYGGTLNFKIGASSERPVFSFPLTLKAYNGPVTIGQ